jgi:Ca-activated chloride channel homolog
VIREGNLRPGTNISEPLKIAATSFRDDGDAQKAIFVISDGEDLGEGAVEAVRDVRDRDIRLYTVGLGTDEGSTLPVPDPRTGQVRTRTDPGGQPAISRANESLMRAVAAAGRGKFFNGNSDAAAGEIAQEIAALQRAKFETQEGSLPIERYQWFLAAGLALIAIETLIPERRRRRKARVPEAQRRQAA